MNTQTRENRQEIEQQLLILHLRLRKIREAKGLTLNQAAALSGGEISAMALGSYERGDRTITANKLIALSALYNLPVSELFASSKDMPTNRTITLDLRAIANSSEEYIPKVLPIVRAIAQQRGDWNGEVISLRTTDIGNFAIFAGVTKSEIEKMISIFSIARSK